MHSKSQLGTGRSPSLLIAKFPSISSFGHMHQLNLKSNDAGT